MLVISFLPLFTNRKISAISHCRYMDDSSSRGPLVLCFVSGKVHVHVISPLSFGLGSSHEKRSARSSDLSSFSAESAVESFFGSMADDFTAPFAHMFYQATAARGVLAAGARVSVWPRKHMRISAVLAWFLSSSIDVATLVPASLRM